MFTITINDVQRRALIAACDARIPPVNNDDDATTIFELLRFSLESLPEIQVNHPNTPIDLTGTMQFIEDWSVALSMRVHKARMTNAMWKAETMSLQSTLAARASLPRFNPFGDANMPYVYAMRFARVLIDAQGAPCSARRAAIIADAIAHCDRVMTQCRAHDSFDPEYVARLLTEDWPRAPYEGAAPFIDWIITVIIIYRLRLVIT